MAEARAKLPPRAFGYTRVSTLDQAINGVSLEAQTEKIKAWCALNGHELADIYVDPALSGGRADNRPALQMVLQSVRRGDVLIVYSLSRLARSSTQCGLIREDLEKRGVGLVSLSEKIDTSSASGQLTFTLLTAVSQFERDVIRERTRMAMQHLKSQGRFTGGGVPFGFQLVGDRVRPYAPEMLVVVMAYRAFKEGRTLREISKEMAYVGIYSRNGGPFNPAQVQRMLKLAPLYFGEEHERLPRVVGEVEQKFRDWIAQEKRQRDAQSESPV